MRYRIYCGEVSNNGRLPKNANTALYDSADPESKRMIETGRLSLGLNKAGGMTMTLLKGHWLYDNLHIRKTVIEVFDGDTAIWRGRVLKYNDDKNLRRVIEFEGNLNGTLDIPDHFTNPSAIVKHYKLGSEILAKTLSFAETSEGSGLYFHEWADSDGFETLYETEFGALFYIVWDGTEYAAYMNGFYQNSGSGDVRVGFLGDLTIYDDRYSKMPDDPGSSAPFYIANLGIYTKASATSHDVKIYRRDPMTVQTMFNWMFAATGGYNSYQTPENYLKLGTCNVTESEIYDPKPETSCMDTLRHWLENYGGYIYTTFVPIDAAHPLVGDWYVNYTSNIGQDRNDVQIASGLNLIDISITADGSDVLTALYGIGELEEDGTVINLEEWTPPPNVIGTGYTLEQNGYIQYITLWSSYGAVRKRKVYSIPPLMTANKYTYLALQVQYDLAAALQKKAIRVIALDARLIDGDSSGRPDLGDNIPISAEPWGLTGSTYKLNEMDIDFINPGNGTLRLGNEQKKLTQLI